MKKSLLVLGMITCIFGLTACGTEKEEVTLMSEEAAVAKGEEYVEKVVDIYESGNLEAYKEDEEYKLFVKAVDSLESASEDMGRVIGKQGRIAKAIRTVMKAAATRAGEKVIVEID